MTEEAVISGFEIFSDNTSCNIVTVTPVSISNVISFTSLSPKCFFFHLAFDCVANFLPNVLFFYACGSDFRCVSSPLLYDLYH